MSFNVFPSASTFLRFSKGSCHHQSQRRSRLPPRSAGKVVGDGCGCYLVVEDEFDRCSPGLHAFSLPSDIASHRVSGLTAEVVQGKVRRALELKLTMTLIGKVCV